MAIFRVSISQIFNPPRRYASVAQFTVDQSRVCTPSVCFHPSLACQLCKSDTCLEIWGKYASVNRCYSKSATCKVTSGYFPCLQFGTSCRIQRIQNSEEFCLFFPSLYHSPPLFPGNVSTLVSRYSERLNLIKAIPWDFITVKRNPEGLTAFPLPPRMYSSWWTRVLRRCMFLGTPWRALVLQVAYRCWVRMGFYRQLMLMEGTRTAGAAVPSALPARHPVPSLRWAPGQDERLHKPWSQQGGGGRAVALGSSAGPGGVIES